MESRRLIIAYIFLLFHTALSQAASNQNELNSIAESETWHKLLLLEKKAFSNSYKSAINDKDFLLTQTDAVDVNAELLATISAFKSASLADNNEHPQCKYRGRYFWLKKQLPNESKTWPKLICSDYEDWSLNGTTTSLSIVYATGYLGNPASYYGHTFIKLNSSEINKKTSLEDVSVNFGALIPPKEGPLKYITKGLFGGYDSGFSHIQFYFHNHNYGESELRDLWEYELDLSHNEIELILGHIWEVLGKKYTYYFLDRNCVYRMAEILEVVPSIKINPNNGLWTIPQALIQKLTAGKNSQGNQLVKDINFIPSRQSKFYKRFQNLNKKEKLLLANLIEKNRLLHETYFLNLPLDNQHAIIDTLLDYYKYLSVKDKNKKIWQDRYREVLLIRFKLPQGSSPHQELNVSVPPHKGRPPSMVGLSGIANSKATKGLALHFRPAYYDALDSGSGHIPHSSLSMLETSLIAQDDTIKLDNLRLIKIENIPRNSTNLKEDKGKTWLLESGWEKLNLACTNDCITPYARAKLGRVFNAASNFSYGAMLGGGLQKNTAKSSPVYGSLNLFSFWDINESTKLMLSVEQRQAISDSEKYHPTLISLETHWTLSRRSAIRFSLQKNSAWEGRMGIRHYF